MIWKTIIDYPKYEVSDEGLVRRGTKILKSYPDTDGYQIVGLCKNGKCVSVKVHRLVALAFIDNPENKPQVNHKDADKGNNRDWNLEWATQPENIQHGLRLGIIPRGGIKNLQFSDDEVRYIRNCKSEGSKKKDVYAQFSDRSRISFNNVWSGTCYKWVKQEVVA